MLTGKNLSEISSTYTVEILLVTIIFFTTDKAPHFLQFVVRVTLKILTVYAAFVPGYLI